jgi:hypothetical protein
MHEITGWKDDVNVLEIFAGRVCNMQSGAAHCGLLLARLLSRCDKQGSSFKNATLTASQESGFLFCSNIWIIWNCWPHFMDKAKS